MKLEAAAKATLGSVPNPTKIFLVTLVLLFLDYAFPHAENHLWKVLLQFTIFCLCYSPFMLKLNKELELVSTFKKKWAYRTIPPETTTET